MWEHHMTSPSFGGNFKEVFERVVVQIWPYNLGKPFFKKIKIKQINQVISYTDKRKVFLERLNKSNNIFEKKFSLGKTHHNREGSDLKIKMELRNPKF